MMNRTFIAKMNKSNFEDLYNLSLESSKSKDKEVFIFEKGSMDDFLPKDKSEEIKLIFLNNNIKVKQITNIPVLPKFTDNVDFINKVMLFRYVSKDIFLIENEILIFDNIVAIYNEKELLVIEDQKFSNTQKQLFMNILDQWQSPALNFEYKPNHSFYKNLNFFLDGLQIIVWPDVEAKKSYKWLSEIEIWEYIKDIIKNDDYYNDSSYIIAFIWSLNWEKMIDIWKFTQNHVDDRSGPLWDVRVYREWKICNNLWLASGNTLLVLWYEEKLRRQSKNLQDYLDWPVPKLPLEIVNWKNFF